VTWNRRSSVGRAIAAAGRLLDRPVAQIVQLRTNCYDRDPPIFIIFDAGQKKFRPAASVSSA